MGIKVIIGLIFLIFVTFLLAIYWFIPFSTTEFILKTKPSNFNIENASIAQQFYSNMRFPEIRISYNINTCPLQKKEDMKRAFDIIEEKSILDFYEVSSNEQITVTCDSKAKIEGGMFIAGEGGPTNITSAGEFNVITHGKILLLKQSSCPNPNIAIHELLHVLGFDHSEDPDDIMYALSRCGQNISPYIIDTLDTLYSIPSYPDLAFDNVSAIMRGKYLDTNMSVRNNGFQVSPRTKISIYGDESLIKEIDLDSLEIGHGRVISLTNIWISKISLKELIFTVETNFDELKKENNKVVLKIKNK